jgi:MoaA/NifB/PqqE/SkfB family radical SAM enzyme
MTADVSLVDYSKLRSAARIRLVEQVPLQSPLTIFIEPTNICNFKCTYCPESESDFKAISGGWFKLEDSGYERILDEIGRLPAPPATINFYMMGEPFVNKSLPSMIRRAKQRGSAQKVIVTSNGSLLNRETAERVVESGLDYLRISIYGAFEETHRARTRSAIGLQRIVDNLSGFVEVRAKSTKPFLYVKMIDSGDADENAEFVRRFSAIADEVHIEPVMNWNDIDGKNRANVDKDALLETEYFSRKKEVCPFPFYTLVIHADLRVSVCCVDWSKKAVVGDLKTQSLLDIWNGDALRAFQDLHVQRRRAEIAACASCTFLHTAPDNVDSLAWTDWSRRTRAEA